MVIRPCPVGKDFNLETVVGMSAVSLIGTSAFPVFLYVEAFIVGNYVNIDLKFFSNWLKLLWPIEDPVIFSGVLIYGNSCFNAETIWLDVWLFFDIISCQCCNLFFECFQEAELYKYFKIWFLPLRKHHISITISSHVMMCS